MFSQECQSFLKKAKNNERLVDYLKDNCRNRAFFDWAFVVIFYSALHYFNAFLSYKGKGIPSSHISNAAKDGRIALAHSIFYTNKNGIMDSVGSDFEQLFNWSCDSRYKYSVKGLLGNSEFEAALRMLEAIKLVTFNEIGFRPKKRKGETIGFIKLSDSYRNSLKNIRGLE